MTAKVIYRNSENDVKPGKTVRHALKELGINRESVLVTRNTELITDDYILREGDIIRLIAVISGG